MTKIVCRSNFKLSLNNIDRNKKIVNRDIKYVNKIIDYYSDDKKRALNMIDYFTGKINKHMDINLVLEDGQYATKEETEKRKQYISKQFKNSNIWQIVLSFDKKYIDKNISWRELELKMAKEILPKFFKKMGFENSKNMCYEFSLHTNTKNPHFHISFMERKPNYVGKENKLIYMRTGKISNEFLNYLKRETILTIERNKMFNPLSTNINKDIEELKKIFDPTNRNFVLYNKSNILLEEKILTLGKLINERVNSENQKIKYNSIKDDEIKKLTQEIKNDLFSINKNIEISKSAFNKSIKDMNDYLYNLTKENGININDIDYSYTDNKKEYLENYINNAIVNHARYDYSKNESIIVKPDDVIQSIIYQTYLDNQNYDRKAIIQNSFNNNYPIQYEVDNAIRKINRDQNYICEEVYRSLIKNKKKNKSNTI